MDLELAGRVALVAGSSAGLGFATAQVLAAEGARVAVNGRDAARCEAAAARIRAAVPGAEVLACPGDVARPSEAEALVARVVGHFARLDVLVCNAGGPPPTDFAHAAPDAFQRALDLNLLSAVHLARAAAPGMRERRWGRIICLTSIAARQPLPGLLLSTMARAGTHGFAKALADEVGRDGVLVTVVAPGYMRTGRVTALVDERSRREGRPADEILAEMAATVPLGRIGEPEELAAAIAFLASERASYITGTVLAVDGGYLRAIG
jgi:3-oxoacyl-[acyl-carrier protein] reductase